MSQPTRECYKCKAAGKEGVQILLDSKDASGAWIIKNPDGKPHTHAIGVAKTFQKKGIDVELSTNFSDGSHIKLTDRAYNTTEILAKVKTLKDVLNELDKVMRPPE